MANTIQARRCIQRKMGLEGMSQSQAAKACGVTTQEEADKVGVRLGKKAGGVVKKQARKAAPKKTARKTTAKRVAKKKK